jgi:hypothetical protein
MSINFRGDPQRAINVLDHGAVPTDDQGIHSAGAIWTERTVLLNLVRTEYAQLLA